MFCEVSVCIDNKRLPSIINNYIQLLIVIFLLKYTQAFEKVHLE